MSTTEDLDKYRAPALDKGLDIIELLAGTEEPMSQAEIAKALERSPNEIYRMLDRLVRREYVRRTAADRYELTLKLFELSYMTPPMNRLVSQATPVLRRFARTAEQPVHLVIHDRDILVVVAQVDSPTYWNVSIRVGSRIDLVNTGSGHIFLAFARDEERQMMLENRARRRGDAIPPNLEQRLNLVRTQGFEMMESAQTMSVTNLSVPIFGPLGTVVAAMTSPFSVRLDNVDAPDREQALELLLEAGAELSNRTRRAE